MTQLEMLTLVEGWGFVFGQTISEKNKEKEWAEALSKGSEIVAIFSDSTETTKTKILDSFLKGVAEVL